MNKNIYKFKINYSFIGGSSSSNDNNLFNNVDSRPAHIQATVQNIVLRFGPINEIYGIQEGEVIANKVSDLNASTQSSRWCPLIWRALAKCDKYNVPNELINAYSNEHQIVDKHTNDLKNLEGWCDYAYAVLTHNFNNIPSNSNDFESDYVINQSEYFSNKIKN